MTISVNWFEYDTPFSQIVNVLHDLANIDSILKFDALIKTSGKNKIF